MSKKDKEKTLQTNEPQPQHALETMLREWEQLQLVVDRKREDMRQAADEARHIERLLAGMLSADGTPRIVVIYGVPHLISCSKHGYLAVQTLVTVETAEGLAGSALPND